MDTAFVGQMLRRIRQARMELRVQVGRYPWLYLPARKALKLLGWPGGQFVGKDTEIVIDGFPRSGNSFAVEAFKFAQNRPVSVAHHSHSPAQIMSGVWADIPTVVLLRSPEDAIVSSVVRTPVRSLHQTAREYAIFYETIEQVIDEVVIAPFELVISDMGRVIDQINRRYHCSFRRFEHSEENEQICFERIEETHAKHHDGTVQEGKVARPSTRRDKEKDTVHKKYKELPRNLRERVCRRYEELLAESVG